MLFFPPPEKISELVALVCASEYERIVSLSLHEKLCFPGKKNFPFETEQAFVSKMQSLVNHYRTANERTINEQRKNLAAELNSELSKELKWELIIFLLRQNKDLFASNTDIYGQIVSLANNFGLPLSEMNSADEMIRNERPVPATYPFSVLLTPLVPGLNELVDGLKYRIVFKNRIEFWFCFLPVSDVMLVKIVNREFIFPEVPLKPGRVYVVNTSVLKFLKQQKIELADIKFILKNDSSVLPEVHVPETELTPEVILDPARSYMEISGKSVSIDPELFFAPVLKWIGKFRFNPRAKFEIHIRLDYFNTKTARQLMKIFLKCRELELTGVKVAYYWHHASDDADLKECGEDFQSAIERSFNFIIAPSVV